MKRSIKDLLEQATRECFVRGIRLSQQINGNKTRVDLRILTCVKNNWHLILYWAGEFCVKKEDNCLEKLGPFNLEVKKIYYDQAQIIMQQMTEEWKKQVHGIDAIKIPFHFYDGITNQVMHQHNVLVNIHLATLVGMYCARGYITDIPYGDELFYRLQGLQSRCIKELQKVFTV